MRLLFIMLPLVTLVSCAEKSTRPTQDEKERIRWNVYFNDPNAPFNHGPNAFLAKAIQHRKPGKALDDGMGQGRNTLFLAEKGWDVTGIDVADEAVAMAKKEAKAKNLKITALVKSDHDFDFGTNQWDLIDFIYEGCVEYVPGLVEKIKQGLKKDGIFVFEHFHYDAGVVRNTPWLGCKSKVEKDLFIKAGGFKIKFYKEKEGRADYGNRPNDKIIYMIVEKK